MLFDVFINCWSARKNIWEAGIRHRFDHLSSFITLVDTYSQIFKTGPCSQIWCRYLKQSHGKRAIGPLTLSGCLFQCFSESYKHNAYIYMYNLLLNLHIYWHPPTLPSWVLHIFSVFSILQTYQVTEHYVCNSSNACMKWSNNCQSGRFYSNYGKNISNIFRLETEWTFFVTCIYRTSYIFSRKFHSLLHLTVQWDKNSQKVTHEMPFHWRSSRDAPKC